MIDTLLPSHLIAFLSSFLKLDRLSSVALL
jgi:hypothetical protein